VNSSKVPTLPSSWAMPTWLRKCAGHPAAWGRHFESVGLRGIPILGDEAERSRVRHDAFDVRGFDPSSCFK